MSSLTEQQRQHKRKRTSNVGQNNINEKHKTKSPNDDKYENTANPSSGDDDISEDDNDVSDEFSALPAEEKERRLREGKKEFMKKVKTFTGPTLRDSSSSASRGHQVDKFDFELSNPLEYTAADIIMTKLTSAADGVLNNFFNKSATLDVLSFSNLFSEQSTYIFHSVILINETTMELAFRLNALNFIIVFVMTICRNTSQSTNIPVNKNWLRIPLMFTELFRDSASSANNLIKQQLKQFISTAKITFIEYRFEQLSRERDHSGDKSNRWFV